MHIPAFVRDRLPFLGVHKASYRQQDGRCVFTPGELQFEAERRGLDPKRIYSVGCLSCHASATWPPFPWFGHFANCNHEDSPAYMQFAVADKHNVLRLSSPPAQIRDRLFDEHIGT